MMNALQPTRSGRPALASVLAILLITIDAGAQPAGRTDAVASVAPSDDGLSHGGVFEDGHEIDQPSEAALPSTVDDRIRWLTFYLIYTDETLSNYAPGGAMGARFDLFQFAGFPGSQPRGYPIHIIVRNARTTLMGVVRTRHDKRIAEMRAREVAGVLGVENALRIAQGEDLP